MPAAVDGEFQLGAHAIIGGDQQRVFEPGGFQIEKAAKSAQVGIGAGTAGGLRQRRDGFHQRIACGDVYARLRIAIGMGVVG